ncbi:ABC transporter [Candidatus Woesebacteria bacterium RIFCSPHIGHO2_01_FULL_44_10]|uniref:ABC transporter n=1 Tax=Candidatus Woesebacteria bacterium RIFCSPLOWO2_01_FULL_44_14 TaxID=1802525 RepID=A0A1F8C2X0_9BACT|nr:MAG: ABC transporter [Candidatus Woesebacteria bacterium RIFCSPHIGHO2_01_FULL_44_10]OGM54318.1 MAG: ABC transporter [Candidatus Woesebacteria bacterium RIFCSPHIGHO2_12_FULL_44_11]OGM70219.1 MAG: ABC transporter [Candidatus Woesebacteria bacterium RIFCSPLOWO2_01_FULL_44_14]
MEKAVVISHLIKNFEVVEKKPGLVGSIKSFVSPTKKTIRALREISLSVDEGELVGFIGPNGAGKTTTLKILSGILYPQSGFVQVLGFTPWDRKPAYLKQISLVMGQKNQLWWDLPAIESFNLNKAIYEIKDSKYNQSLGELVKLLEVEKFLEVPVRRLSLGQRMRMELIAALLHKPKMVFLDEPTIGLDLVAQQKVRDFIVDYNRRHQATILLTSHNMEDLVGIAKRIIIIDQGKILFDGELADIVSQHATDKIIKVTFSKNVNIASLENIGKIKSLRLPQVELVVPRATAAVAASEILQNFPVSDLTIEEESIESIIRDVFKTGVIKKTKLKKTV